MTTRQIILDTETTGLSPSQGHRIIEIGAVELLNRRITGNNFHCYLNPEREIDQEAFQVHGLNFEFLKDKPKFAQIAQDFIEFITDAELIIHNAPFDTSFLNYELSLLTGELSRTKLEELCKIFDTLAHARQIHPGQANNLDALCRRYGIDNSRRDLHGALLDANLLAHVYLAMTGGQISLSVDERLERPSEDLIRIERLNQTITTILIKASEEEERQHELFLQKMRQTNPDIKSWDE